MDFPDWKCSKKLQRKKTITTIQIHYNVLDYRNVNNDISGNMIEDSMIRAHKIILEQTKIDLYTRFAHVCTARN